MKKVEASAGGQSNAGFHRRGARLFECALHMISYVAVDPIP